MSHGGIVLQATLHPTLSLHNVWFIDPFARDVHDLVIFFPFCQSMRNAYRCAAYRLVEVKIDSPLFFCSYKQENKATATEWGCF